MTAHSSGIEISSDQPPLPNQHFSSWLRSQTTLFVSQIVAILTFVLFIAEEVYYVSHFGEHQGLLKPLTIKLIVDIAHIVFMAIFILVLIRFLDDNERGSHRVELVQKRVFGKRSSEDEGTYQKTLKDSKDQLKKFKIRFLWFWIGMLVLYVCFACQHGYRLANPKEEISSRAAHNTPAATNKHSEGQEETKKTDAGLHVSEPAGPASPNNSSLQQLDGEQVWSQLAFPGLVFSLNNLTLFFVYLCFLILYIPADKMKPEYRKHRNYSVGIVILFTAAYPALALLAFKFKEFTSVEWNAYSAVFDALSGFTNAVVLALLIARVDSKLVGLPSWLISILYSYAAAQPLFMVFELNQTQVFDKITTAVLIFVFVFKIYFFLIITYALQTGKMLNYLCSFPFLQKHAEDAREKASKPADYSTTQIPSVVDKTEPTPASNTTQTQLVIDNTKSTQRWFKRLVHGAKRLIARIISLTPAGDTTDANKTELNTLSDKRQAQLDKTEPTEGWFMRFLVQLEGLLSACFGSHLQFIPKLLEVLSNLLTKSWIPTVAKVIGLIAIGCYFILLIISVLIQRGPTQFRLGDFQNISSLATKIRPDKDSLSKYLYDKFSPDTKKQLDEYQKQVDKDEQARISPEMLKKALFDELNKVLRDPEFFNKKHFDLDKLDKDIQKLVDQKLKDHARLNQKELDQHKETEMLRDELFDELNKVLQDPEFFKLDTQKLIAQKARINQKQLDEHKEASFPSETLTKRLLDELNKVLRDPELFNKAGFDLDKLDPNTQELIAQRPQGNARINLNRLFLEQAYPDEISKTKPPDGHTWALIDNVVDVVQLAFVFMAFVILYYIRKKNPDGEEQANTTAKQVFGDTVERQHTTAQSKQQLAKFKEYFFYFWFATFFLYIVFSLKHRGIDFGLGHSSPLESMIKIMLYPFLEFSLASLNLLFIFWCFVILRSPAYLRAPDLDDVAVTRQGMLINYSSFVIVLLIAAFPLLLFVIGGPNLQESNLRDYATLFDGVAGALSAVVLALLIARMDSKLFGFSPWLIGLLFAYASIQPLFVVFALNDAILLMVQTSVLITALLLKICFFLITVYALQSGRALNYLFCFPLLKERVDSIFENQFEIKLTHEEEEFTFSILKKNRLYYSTTRKFRTRRDCDRFVRCLREHMKNDKAYKKNKSSGTHWVEVRTGIRKRLGCESIPLRSEKEACKLIEESIEKIPYCKYNRT